MRVLVHLLGDVPDLIEPIGRMRCAEWGSADEVQKWISTTGREAGRDELPRRAAEGFLLHEPALRR